MLSRPEATEYAEYYSDYVARASRHENVLKLLLSQESDLREFMKQLTDEQANENPEPGKWSPKEVIGHLCDAERILCYRALRFARGDEKELQGFEQDDYVAAGNFNARTRNDLSTEFKMVRGSTFWLFSNLSDEALMRSGVANGSRLTVRALAYIIAGHAQRHLELMKARFPKASAQP
jgi:hypothetical protein